MGAFLGASNFFNKPLTEIAQNLKYSDANICVLSGDIQVLQAKFPETYNNLASCRYHADNRTAIEYGQDLVASWIIEDIFLTMLNKDGLLTTLDGADRNREILSNTKTSTTSDFEISFNGNSRKLELMNDYTGYWSKNNILHLRDKKYVKMQEECSLFLAVSILTKEFAIIDFSSDVPSQYIPHHYPYGGKPAYSINLTEECFLPATSSIIISTIKDILS